MAHPLDNEILIELVNPAISLVLACAFFLFWMFARTRRYLLGLAAGYVMSALGFLFQRFELPIGFAATKLVSNVGFAAATFLIASAVCLRYDRKVPYAGFTLLIGCGLAAFTWFLYFEPSLTWRIYAMSFALGGVSVLVAMELRTIPDKSPVEVILYGVAILTSLNFFARTIIIIYSYGAFESYDGFYTSFYWTSLLLSHALLSLCIALCLMVAGGMDVLKEFRTESRTDPLSGLLNRRGFEDRVDALVTRPSQAPAGYSLIMADLDHFKLVNDRHGHAVGDAVIAAFAGLLQKTGGARSIIGRTGGEEFAVLLPDGDLASAQNFAEALRTALLLDGLSGAASVAGAITCSFGVAERTGAEDLGIVLKRADDALMHAKRAGRDRVRVVYARPVLGVPPLERLHAAV